MLSPLENRQSIDRRALFDTVSKLLYQISEKKKVKGVLVQPYKNLGLLIQCYLMNMNIFSVLHFLPSQVEVGLHLVEICTQINNSIHSNTSLREKKQKHACQ